MKKTTLLISILSFWLLLPFFVSFFQPRFISFYSNSLIQEYLIIAVLFFALWVSASLFVMDLVNERKQKKLIKITY